MIIFPQPPALSRRPEVLGAHPDLQTGEKLIQMADEDEVMDALVLMAANLAKYYGSESPVCVPIKRGAAVLKLDAAKHDLDELLIAAAMTAGKDDWVVGIGDSEHDGFDLSDRFRRNLPGVWHIQIPSP